MRKQGQVSFLTFLYSIPHVHKGKWVVAVVARAQTFPPPVTIPTIPIPPAAIDGFRRLLPWVDATDIEPNLIAYGQYGWPPPMKETGFFDGSKLEVTKRIEWRVTVRMAFVYNAARVGFISD